VLSDDIGNVKNLSLTANDKTARIYRDSNGLLCASISNQTVDDSFVRLLSEFKPEFEEQSTPYMNQAFEKIYIDLYQNKDISYYEAYGLFLGIKFE